MKCKSTLFPVLTLFLGSALAADGGMGKKMSAGNDGGMSMMEMTGKSQGACMAAADTLDGLLKTVQAARKSNDKGKMKAALEQVEKHIAGMRSHMGACMDMMGMMGKMMGGGMMGGENPPPKPAASEEDHQKHHPKP